MSSELREIAKIMGRKGGLKGGRARAEAISDERLKEIARNAANARWKKTKPPLSEVPRTCPYCGAFPDLWCEHNGLPVRELEDGKFVCFCDCCGALGPPAADRQKAVRYWNRDFDGSFW